MTKDKTFHGYRAKGRIKGSRKVVNPCQKEVPIGKDLSTNVNQLCIQRKNMNFKSDVTNQGQEFLLKKAIYAKGIMSLKYLKIHRVNWYEEERSTKMSE